MKSITLNIKIIFCCAFMLVSASSWASLEEGLSAVEQGDYLSAYQLFKKLAEQGDIEAQHNLAILYKTGKGVMKDPEKAIKWFRKAADKGLADAQFYLGRMYDKGEGVEQGFEYAAIWYIKAAVMRWHRQIWGSCMPMEMACHRI